MRQEFTLSSGESSAEVDTESEDMAEGGLAGAERSEREVEALVGKHYKHQEQLVCVSYVLDHEQNVAPPKATGSNQPRIKDIQACQRHL